MNDNRASYKRHARIGPGGMKCACCGAAPGDTRKRTLRTEKRREKRDAMREARTEAQPE